jgi:hypothetical protein
MREDEHNAFRKWGDFLNHLEMGNTPTLNRFAARYKLSRKFRGIDANLAASTLRGYSNIFHVFLAHSAFDALVKGAIELKERKEKAMFVDIGIDKNNYPMFDDDLADEIRKIKGLAEVLIEYADNEKRIVRLKEFFRVPYSEKEYSNQKVIKARNEISEERNLLVVASAIRNVVAHGQLSATGANAVTMKNAATFEKLAKFVELKTFELFQNYVDALLNKYASAKQLNSDPSALG